MCVCVCVCVCVSAPEWKKVGYHGIEAIEIGLVLDLGRGGLVFAVVAVVLATRLALGVPLASIFALADGSPRCGLVLFQIQKPHFLDVEIAGQ